jgi:murein L,D-transpeptidase YcbB/YkuD
MAISRRYILAVVVLILLGALIGVFLLFRVQNEPHESPKLPENPAGSKNPQQELSDSLRALASDDPDLQKFYESSGYTPVWVKPDGWTERGEHAAIALRAAQLRGLPPEIYTVGLNPTEPARLEAAITKDLMRYAADIRTGRWNPNIYRANDSVAPANELARAVADDPDGVEAALSKLDPPFAEFRRLQTVLADYRKRAVDDPTLTDKVEQIERTMERWRWLPHTYNRGPILVNLPEFKLRALNDKLEVALEMNVVVGQLHHPTPLFMGAMKYVVFGPYWNVPSSILNNELIPDIVKDRNYLGKNGYEVVNADGAVVATSEVTGDVLSGLRSGRLRVRQVPGVRNALGKVKFMFPNDNNIYLHDTNSPKLFAREVRAFSHGCVRVSEPQKLAEWVLGDQPAWTPERIVEAMNTTKQQQANLTEPIPVLMLYHTVTVGVDGEAHFLKDLYGRNAELKARMATHP